MQEIRPLKDFLECGLRVFPVTTGAKGPPLLKDFRNNASNSLDDVLRWSRNFPKCNWAAYAGENNTGDSFFVLDIDLREKKDGFEFIKNLEQNWGPFPDTLKQSTPSGGKHYFFKSPFKIANAVGLAPGVDIRGTGGYVLIAPSKTPLGRYQIERKTPILDAPAFLLERLRKPVEISNRGEKSRLSFDNPPDIQRAEYYLKREAPFAIQGQGGDQTTFVVACILRDFGLSPEKTLELMHDFWNAKCQPPWSTDELFKKVTNAFNYGKSEAGIRSVSDFFPIENSFPSRVTKSPGTFPYINFQDLRVPVEPPFLIQNILPQHSLAMVYGPPNVGKSTIAATMAFAVASGSDFLGTPARQGSVVYIAAESPIGFQKRLLAIRSNNPKVEAESIPLTTVTAAPNLYTGAEDLCILRATLKELSESAPLDLIIFDTLARVTPGCDENSSKEVGLFLRNIEALRVEFNATVLIVHHSGKSESLGPRGSSALMAALDSCFAITKNEDHFSLKCTKQRDAEYFEPLFFKLSPVTLDPRLGISGVIAEPTTGSTTPEMPRPGSHAARLLGLVKELGGGGSEVRQDDLRAGFFIGMAANKSAKSNAFKRGLEELKHKKLLVVTERGGALYVAPL